MSLEVAKFLEAEVASKVAVTDAEVDAFYKQNLDRFKQADSVHARHILIGVPQNATAGAKNRRKTKAQVALSQLKRGRRFEEVAEKMSSGSRQRPERRRPRLLPEGTDDAAVRESGVRVKAGQTSGIVETPFGFHIIKVLERRGPRTAPFAEVAGRSKSS